MAFALVLAAFAARAWVVETNRGRLTTAGSAQRGLTAAVVGSVALLLVMMVFNGGTTLADLLINGDPSAVQEAQDQVQGPVGPTGEGG
ncbi:hypothetical protein ACLFMI_17185 [Pseudonocardia nantongensis]|uniref:hypothetical protein n=1 Tax=Pseudonocardia nantongensis TaxID=1181885 RepID=UPI00397BF684